VTDTLAAMIAGFWWDGGWRAAMCDLFSEHPELARTPVQLNAIPRGFHRWWHASGANRRLKTRFRLGRYGSSKSDITFAFRNDRATRSSPSCNWFDHGGATIIAGIPALVGEPYTDVVALDAVSESLAADLLCPVSYANGSFWGSEVGHQWPNRVIVWFGFPVPPR
jgi:hypothetical protein